jgi:hypothetical protein
MALDTMTLYGAHAQRMARILGMLGGLALLICLIWSLAEGASADSFPDCHGKPLKSGASTDTDKNGVLRIVDMWPTTIRLSGRLCVAVAGVAKTNDQTLVEISLFLNGHRVPVQPADGANAPAFAKATAKAMPDPQVLTYEFGRTDSATSESGKFWRDLLAGRTRRGLMQLSAGVSRSAAAPDEPAIRQLQVRVYRVEILAVGAIAMALLLAAFTVFAANSTVLRDSPLTVAGTTNMTDATAAAAAAKSASDANSNDAALKQQAAVAAANLTWLQDNPNQPVGTFSLGRTQMALWLGLVTAGFIFLWLTLGFYLNVITASILVLLGLNGATGLAAVAIDQPATAAGTSTQRQSKSFLSDLISDGSGPKLHRIQVVIWTLILAVIFFWNTVWNFVFVDFDTNLLLLMGIANAMYLGFKPSETV